MQTLAELTAAIRPLNHAAMARAQETLNGLVKPLGSLGRLEQLALQLAGMPGLDDVRVPRKQILVIAADHGVYAEGIAVSPRDITARQSLNVMQGLTGVAVLAAQAGVEVRVVDTGIDADPIPQVVDMKVQRGSGNIMREPAMRYQQANDLLLRVARYVLMQVDQGVRAFGVGELGMGNTTPAAAMISVFTGYAPAEVVGTGANYPPERLHHKIAVVEQAIRINQPDAADGVDVLAKVGGFDLVGMTGVMLGAAAAGVPVVLDGFLSYASALAACRIAPQVRDYLIPSHLSAEKGAQIALSQLQLEPYLHLAMRLGEGSGAAVAMHLLDAACAIYHNMGTLAQGNIAAAV